MLMGDAAIQGMNDIARRNTKERAIPAGSNYRIRKGTYNMMEYDYFHPIYRLGQATSLRKARGK